MQANYAVSNIVPVPEGRARQLRATFDLLIPGFGTIKLCRYLEDGATRFVNGPSLRDQYHGWFQTVYFEPEAAVAILAAYDAAAAERTVDLAAGASERVE